MLTYAQSLCMVLVKKRGTVHRTTTKDTKMKIQTKQTVAEKIARDWLNDCDRIISYNEKPAKLSYLLENTPLIQATIEILEEIGRVPADAKMGVKTFQDISEMALQIAREKIRLPKYSFVLGHFQTR